MLWLAVGCGGVGAERTAASAPISVAASESGSSVPNSETAECAAADFRPHEHVNESTSGDESSEFPLEAQPTPAQTAAAEAFRDAVQQGTAPYRTVESARAAGYDLDEMASLLKVLPAADAQAVRSSLASGMVNHLFNARLANDGFVVKPDRPDGLMFATDGEKSVLAGAVFLAPVCTHGPQIAGPLTVWHTHPGITCYDGTAPVGAPLGFRPGKPATEPLRCAVGELLETSPEMLHVWFDAPDLRSTFATAMSASWAIDRLSK